MTDMSRDDLDLRDEDKLPWLEPVEQERDDDGVSPLKLAAGVLAALVVLGLVIAGVWWLRERNAGAEAGRGNGALITAPAGDYKVKPDEPGGMKVEGEGDASFAASEGAEANGRIDTGAIPEAPVTGKRAVPTRPAAPVATGSARVADGGRMPAPSATRAATAQRPAAIASGQVVQLGAYNSAATAEAAWTRLSRRFGYLAPLTRTVTPVTIGGGTLYRLRADTGSANAARALCGRLEVAGEKCLVAVN